MLKILVNVFFSVDVDAVIFSEKNSRFVIVLNSQRIVKILINLLFEN